MSSSSSPTEVAATADAASGMFDVREFARTARGSHRDELDLEAVRADGLTDDAAGLVRVLRDLERSTMQRMRNVLVTATHKDARVTAFLTTWAFEKFWVADALDAVLEAAGRPVEATEHGKIAKPRGERAERRGPILRAILGNIQGPSLVAAHVTAGLVDEWVSTAAYRRLADVAHALTGFAEMVVALKQRHIDFLAEDSERRLAASAADAKLARTILKQSVWPIGIVERPAEDRALFTRLVLAGDAGRELAADIAERVAALPRLAAMGPVVTARLAP